jgi:excisionase family DNA binding protein
MERILEEIIELKQLIIDNNLLQKEILDFEDVCKYLKVSASHLYKLTSTRQIPHFCPQGKKLYFNRAEIDEWLQRNPITPRSSIQEQAANYVIEKGKR